MNAARSRFSGFSSRSRRAKAAGAVIACAVLLAGCGGSAGSSAESGAPVIRGDVTATSPLTVSGTAENTVTITLTTAGGTGTDAVSYATTGTNCQVTGTSLTATAAGTCDVTATKGTQTATATFQFKPDVPAGGLLAIISGIAASIVSDFSEVDALSADIAAAAAAAEANPSLGQATLTVSNTPLTGTVGTNIALTTSGGSGTGAVTFSATGTGCSLNGGTSLKATVAGTCIVTATKWWSTGYLPAISAATTFTFTTAITFTANLGTGTMANQTANVATALTANAFTRPGYVFDGWATTLNGSNAYADGASYPFTANATLYARWLQIPTVTFNANLGTGTMANQTANVATALTANAFTKTGFAFDGWATTSTGDKAYGNGDNYTFGENATLYARWAAVTVPGSPGLTSIARKTGTEVWVTFSAPSSNGGVPITGYTVTLKGPNGGSLIQSFPAQAGSVSVGQLNKNGYYTFTVRAVNSVGTSTPSSATRYLNRG